MEYLTASILISVLIFYFNYHGDGGAKKNASFSQINSFALEPGQNIVWQRQGHVTPSEFAFTHFRFYRRPQLESNISSPFIRFCVEPEESDPARGDPDLYVAVADEYSNGVGYEADRHDASATSFGLDCVSFEWPGAERDSMSALVGIYGYAPFPHPSPPIPYRFFVVTAHVSVEIKDATPTPIPGSEGSRKSRDYKGNDFEEDSQGGTGPGSFTNPPPPLAKRFVRRESGRKQKSEPVLWTILIGFLNILAEIL